MKEDDDNDEEEIRRNAMIDEELIRLSLTSSLIVPQSVKAPPR